MRLLRHLKKIPLGLWEYLLLLAASSLRFLYYGFTYFPQLDDYIQFYKYAHMGDPAGLIERLGLLAARPLSGLADIFLWSKFWTCPALMLLILAALWAGSAFLFRRVFDRIFGCGSLFTAACLLLPLSFEGTYWFSAATRIVCGMFFAALAMHLFLQHVRNGKKYALPLWVLCQLLAFGFYEPTLALAGAGILLLMLREIYHGCRRAWWGMLTFANLLIYFAFTYFHSVGALANRVVTVLPWEEGYFTFFLPDLLRQMAAAFAKGGSLTLVRGAWRGIKIIASDGGWWYPLLFAALAVGFAFLCLRTDKKDRPTEGKRWEAYLFAAIFAAAPLTPYLIVANPWFSLRGTVPAFPGLALLLALAAADLFRRRTLITPILTAVFVLVCGVASVSELHDYRVTYENDTAVLTALADELDGAEGRIGILNLNPNYLEEQNYFYHEHLHGVTESDWALQGALFSYTEEVPKVIPLATDGFSYYVGWNREMKRIGGFDTLYWWDNAALTLTPLTAEGSDETGWQLFTPDGICVAGIWEEDGYGYIEIN